MPTVTTTYPVIDDDVVFLTVVIGDGQSGGSAAFLGPVQLSPGPAVEDVEVGPGAGIRGRFLTVSSTVVDIRPEHDNTSVTVVLRGGSPAEFPIVQAAKARPGGAVNYLTVVKFV